MHLCRVGVKLYVYNQAASEYRLAEILAIQTRSNAPAYYVHYKDFNKRLDEWVSQSRLDLAREVEFPTPEKPASQKKAAEKNGKASKADGATPRAQKRPRTGSTAQKAPKNRRVSIALPEEESPLTPGVETPGAEDDEDDDMEDEAKGVQDPVGFSKEREIEKLRSHGSMTQSAHEISRVRNLSKIQIGRHEVEPWYFSPYPVEFTEQDCVYICEFCLSYYGDQTRFTHHRLKCTLLHPPGNEIYRDNNVSFFEIDGRRQRTWCRNLCLLSKCFLDHKTLYYDVDPFLFYVMTSRDTHGNHLIGYFSKEKESAEGYNVACILTLPQYQRHGYGKLLIAFSYELSKVENKLGSPEKPLSDLGLLSYRAYWQDTIVEILLNTADTTIDELAQMAAMTQNDVLHTLRHLHMLKYFKGQHVICLTDAVIAQYERQQARLKEKEQKEGKKMTPRKIDRQKLSWKPPTFTSSNRTWNW